jgi:hypothetical protein
MNEEDLDAEESLEDLIDRRQMYRDLQRSLGWAEFAKFIEGQIAVRKQQDLAFDIISDPLALNKLIELRAERRALQMALDLPRVIIDNLTEDIEYGTRSDESDS